jgi:hypothetical protein
MPAFGEEPVREHVGQPGQRLLARKDRAVPGQVGAVHVVRAAAVDGATPQTSLVKQSGEGERDGLFLLMLMHVAARTRLPAHSSYLESSG